MLHQPLSTPDNAAAHDLIHRREGLERDLREGLSIRRFDYVDRWRPARLHHNDPPDHAGMLVGNAEEVVDALHGDICILTSLDVLAS